MLLLARWLGNPIVLVVLTAVIAADVVYWRYARSCHRSLLGGDSVVSSSAVRMLAGRWPCTALVEGPEGALSLRARGSGSVAPGADLLWDESDLPQGERVVAHLRCPVVTTTVGLAAPVMEVTPYRLVVEPAAPAGGLTMRQEVAGRYMFARYMEAWMHAHGRVRPGAPVPTLLARGDGVVTRVNTAGLVHDCVVLGMMGVAGASACLMPWWVRRVVGGGASTPVWTCRACGYDLRGLPGRACPECGSSGDRA